MVKIDLIYGLTYGCKCYSKVNNPIDNHVLSVKYIIQQIPTHFTNYIFFYVLFFNLRNIPNTNTAPPMIINPPQSRFQYHAVTSNIAKIKSCQNSNPVAIANKSNNKYRHHTDISVSTNSCTANS